MQPVKFIFIFAYTVFLISCGKQDEAPKIENQSNTQNIQPQTQPLQDNSPNAGKIWWVGTYIFEESAKNVTGVGAQSWDYTIDIKAIDASTLAAFIIIDGYQTSSRIEAKVNATAMDIEFIFDKYTEGNMFETFKKGDRLFAMMRNTEGVIMTVWDKLQPNVATNREDGKVMFKKIAS
jgi:hypothetical protein